MFYSFRIELSDVLLAAALLLIKVSLFGDYFYPKMCADQKYTYSFSHLMYIVCSFFGLSNLSTVRYVFFRFKCETLNFLVNNTHKFLNV
jgi:hypothetical protein